MKTSCKFAKAKAKAATLAPKVPVSILGVPVQPYASPTISHCCCSDLTFEKTVLELL